MQPARSAVALLPPLGLRLLTTARSGAQLLERVHPAWVLAPLVAVQWGALVALALTTKHNGWLYYNGGDATNYWTEAHAVAHGHVPRTVLGYVLPVFYSWVPHLLGATTMLEGLPAIVAFQASVLVPAAVVLVYLVGRRLAGKLFGLLTAAVWVLAPLFAIRLFRPTFRPDYETFFLLPHGYGLTNMGDFPSLVIALAVALFVFRVLDTGSRNDAVVLGLLLGLLVGTKPSNALLVPAAAVVLLAARRWPHLLWAAAGAAPAVLTLALWKQKGLGTLPLLSMPETREAAGTLGFAGIDTGRYLDLSWPSLHENAIELREVFWDVRLLEYIPVAGTFALVRRAPLKGVYVALWFVGFMLVKGSAEQAHVYSTSYFRLAEPGFPAFVLMLAGLALLVPTWGRRAATPQVADGPLRVSRGLVAAVAVAAVAPLVVVASLPAAPARAQARDAETSTEAPVSDSLALSARAAAGGIRLDWRRAHTGSSSVHFVVYRFEAGDDCRFESTGVKACMIDADPLAATRSTTFLDRPPPGRWTYRVAMEANYARDAKVDSGDLMLMSEPATASTR